MFKHGQLVLLLVVTGGFRMREQPLASVSRESLGGEGGSPAASDMKQPAVTPKAPLDSPWHDRQPDGPGTYSPETQRLLRADTLKMGEEEVQEVDSSKPITPTQRETGRPKETAMSEAESEVQKGVSAITRSIIGHCLRFDRDQVEEEAVYVRRWFLLEEPCCDIWCFFSEDAESLQAY